MNPHRILVIDPDPAVHQLLASALPAPEWQLEHSYGWLEGLARLRAAPYRCLIADTGLPGLDAPDLLPRLRGLGPATHVVLLCAQPTADAVFRAIRERALAFFGKPLPASALAEIVARAMDTPAWPDDLFLESGQPEWVAMRARCQTLTAFRLVQFLREIECDIPAPRRDDIAAALRELLMNAIEHGGHYDSRKWVRVSMFRAARALICHIQDPGNGFSLGNIPHAAVSNPPGSPVRHLQLRVEQGVRPGGFGILLTRNLVDDLLYSEAGNEVLFVKYL